MNRGNSRHRHKVKGVPQGQSLCVYDLAMHLGSNRHFTHNEVTQG